MRSNLIICFVYNFLVHSYVFMKIIHTKYMYMLSFWVWLIFFLLIFAIKPNQIYTLFTEFNFVGRLAEVIPCCSSCCNNRYQSAAILVSYCFSIIQVHTQILEQLKTGKWWKSITIAYFKPNILKIGQYNSYYEKFK